MVCVTNTGNRPVVLYRRWEQTSRSRLAGAGFKPPGAAAFKRRGGERPGKSHPEGWQVRVEKMNESEPSDDASLSSQGAVETEVACTPQDQPGRYLFTGPVAAGV